MPVYPTTLITPSRSRPFKTPAVRLRSRIVLTSLALFILLVSANLSTSLYPLLQKTLGIGAFGITLAFSSYVLALITGLLLFRRIADTANRRTVLVASLTAAALATAALAFAPTLGWFTVARAAQGVAVACATGIGSGAMRALLPDRPGFVARLTLLATSGGVAAGPVIGGVLSMGNAPLLTPYLSIAVALLVLVPLILIVAPHAECTPAPINGTVALPDAPVDLAREREFPPAAAIAQRTSRVAAATGFVSFAVFGLCLSLAPTHFATIAQTESRPLIGILAALVLGSSALVQLIPFTGKWRLPSGLAILSLALICLALAGFIGSISFLVVTCLLAGAGQGIAFQAAFTAATAAVDPRHHASTVSAIYTVTYLGSALPVIALGLLTDRIGILQAVTTYAIVIAAACAALAIFALTRATDPLRPFGRSSTRPAPRELDGRTPR